MNEAAFFQMTEAAALLIEGEIPADAYCTAADIVATSPGEALDADALVSELAFGRAEKRDGVDLGPRNWRVCRITGTEKYRVLVWASVIGKHVKTEA